MDRELWCFYSDLELVRASPRKAARTSAAGVRKCAASTPAQRPDIEIEVNCDIAPCPELAPHERGRKLTQSMRGTGAGTSRGLGGPHKKGKTAWCVCRLRLRHEALKGAKLGGGVGAWWELSGDQC